MKSYDDQSYTTQNKKYAFTSIYNDRNLGGNVILSNTSVTNNQLNFSVQINRNEHKSHTKGVRSWPTAILCGVRDLDDRYLINEKMVIDRRIVLCSTKKSESRRSSYRWRDYRISPKFASGSERELSANWIATQQFSMSAYVARKTRFATLKERYSYKMGQGLEPRSATRESHTYRYFAPIRSVKKLVVQQFNVLYSSARCHSIRRWHRGKSDSDTEMPEKPASVDLMWVCTIWFWKIWI